MDGYLINARDKPALLVAFMKDLAGNARISLEGNLATCDFSAFPEALGDPIEPFQRDTISPIQDYIILPLSAANIPPILAQLLPEGRCVHDVLHIHIEQAGKIAFAACDQFHPECTWAWPDAEPLLGRLQELHVISSYQWWPDDETCGQ